MILAATGHRPDKLGGYSMEIAGGLMMLAVKHIDAMKPTEVISGMALGWDMAVAEAAVFLNVPFVAAVPFTGQAAKWPPESRAIYSALIAKAKSVTIVSPGGFATWKMHARNKWMVKNADHMLALWNGKGGGTKNCIEEANKRGKPITNVWDEWSKR